MGTRLAKYFRSLRNSQKFLTSKPSEEFLEAQRKTTRDQEAQPQQSQTYNAVIYGASTKAGKAFANFLAEQGFNLILIERGVEQLNHLEINLKDCIRPPKVEKVVVDQFDQDSLNKALQPVKGLPVKIFVNCKNSRRRNTTQQ